MLKVGMLVQDCTTVECVWGLALRKKPSQGFGHVFAFVPRGAPVPRGAFGIVIETSVEYRMSRVMFDVDKIGWVYDDDVSEV